MMTGEREGLITRIRQIRRTAASTDATRRRPTVGPDDERVRVLEARVAHLEQLVEGLQDSVHRESKRQRDLIAELHAQTQPGAIGAALAKDARNRGL